MGMINPVFCLGNVLIILSKSISVNLKGIGSIIIATGISLLLCLITIFVVIILVCEESYIGFPEKEIVSNKLSSINFNSAIRVGLGNSFGFLEAIA